MELGPKKITKKRLILNEDSNRYEWRTFEVSVGPPPTFKDFPPQGAEDATEEKPPALGGVTPDRLDRSARRGTAGIDRSQTSGDKK